MMMTSKVKYVVLALAAVVVLSGCLQSRTVINVNADGSGTVEETFLMQRDVVQMLSSMGEGEEFSLLDREELERGAGDLGDGVSLQSAEEMSTDWGSGYRAVSTPSWSTRTPPTTCPPAARRWAASSRAPSSTSGSP
jgi:hypothetical protein